MHGTWAAGLGLLRSEAKGLALASVQIPCVCVCVQMF